MSVNNQPHNQQNENRNYTYGNFLGANNTRIKIYEKWIHQQYNKLKEHINSNPNSNIILIIGETPHKLINNKYIMRYYNSEWNIYL